MTRISTVVGARLTQSVKKMNVIGGGKEKVRKGRNNKARKAF